MTSQRESDPAPSVPAATGLRAAGAESFSISAAVGGWRGVAEGAVPTAVFIAVLALAPGHLLAALAGSLTVSAVALVARLVQRQPLTQAVSGALLALISAAWAWKTGQARDFYATGLLINLVWLAACVVSLAARWPVVGLAVGAWQTVDGQARSLTHWRRDAAQAGARRRYALATIVLAGMFALRLAVEVPLYLAGDRVAGALGIARLALGLPLFAVTVWLMWMVVRPVAARSGTCGQMKPADPTAQPD